MIMLKLLSAAAEAGDHEVLLLGLGPEGWVYIGITIFFLIAIFGAKAHRQVLGALDAQIEETRKSLDEATVIRAEAEAMLARARARQLASATEAEAALARARQEAEAIIARAETDCRQLIARREKMAEDKIAAAERAAIAELRAKTAVAAARGAQALIAAGHTAKTDKKLVDAAIAAL